MARAFFTKLLSLCHGATSAVWQRVGGREWREGKDDEAPCPFLDGSFVTEKPDPADIDLILVVSGDHDFSAELTPAEYNVVSKRSVSRRYGFDLLVAREGSEEYRRYLAFFQQVRLEPNLRKGILKFVL